VAKEKKDEKDAGKWRSGGLCVQLYELMETCLRYANKLRTCLFWQAEVVVDVMNFKRRMSFIDFWPNTNANSCAGVGSFLFLLLDSALFAPCLQ